VLQTWSYVFDVIVANDKPYVDHFKAMICKYLAVQEKYSYAILVHLNAVITVGSLAIVAVSTIILSYAKHICGMFTIAR
jgi:hypothetical protein